MEPFIQSTWLLVRIACWAALAADPEGLAQFVLQLTSIRQGETPRGGSVAPEPYRLTAGSGCMRAAWSPAQRMCLVSEAGLGREKATGLGAGTQALGSDDPQGRRAHPQDGRRG
jgi:hypothetical protein